MPPHIYDAAHWRSHAEQALAGAQNMKDPEAKRIVEKIAARYRELAEQAALHEAERQNAEVEESVDRRDEGAAAVTQVTTIVGTFRSTVRQYILRLTRTIAHPN